MILVAVAAASKYRDPHGNCYSFRMCVSLSCASASLKHFRSQSSSFMEQACNGSSDLVQKSTAGQTLKQDAGVLNRSESLRFVTRDGANGH